MNAITAQFQNNTIRIINKNNQAWFVAKDVCTVLGLQNNRDAMNELEEIEKGVAISDTLGRQQKMTIISESGLYALIFKSRKPQAKSFRIWVTCQVLPQINKTGSFSTTNKISTTQQNIKQCLRIGDITQLSLKTGLHVNTIARAINGKTKQSLANIYLTELSKQRIAHAKTVAKSIINDQPTLFN